MATDTYSGPWTPLENFLTPSALLGLLIQVILTTRHFLRLIEEFSTNSEVLDINCVDPLNRSALIAAIENENIELIRLLLKSGIKVKVSGSVKDSEFLKELRYQLSLGDSQTAPRTAAVSGKAVLMSRRPI